LKGLAKDPDARHASAEAFAAALAACPEAGASAPMAPPARTPATSHARLKPRALAIGGAALLVVGTVAAVFYARPAPPSLPAVASAPAPVVPSSNAAARVLELVAADRADEAIFVARAHLAREPHDGAAHAALAAAYQHKLWCSDALEELERAVRDDPRLHRDASVMRHAVACLTPKTQGKAIRFLVEKIGPEAATPLREAAERDPNLEVRRGAERALERLATPQQ
jgi:hypothetical protein